MATARQQDLFSSSQGFAQSDLDRRPQIPLGTSQLLDWQRRVASWQQGCFPAESDAESGPLADQPGPPGAQANLFAAEHSSVPTPAALAARLNPLGFTPQSLQFWRWPQPPQAGAALYLVIDQPPHLDSPLLLYVGETGRADQRWKGEHDCKTYLAAYAEAVLQAGFTTRLSIRFCCDVPAAARPRRALEQALIRQWLPPFNKETRQRWATPFTADPA